MQKKQKISVLGIDGCKSGWIMAKYDGLKFKVSVYPSLHELFESETKVDLAFIDMPIGLSDRYVIRDVDQFARKELKPKRQSSVFNVPSRPALSVSDYETAKEVNQRIEGKSISIQSWNIGKKIKELDSLLKYGHDSRNICREAHPEICFKYLNKGIPMILSKHESGDKGIQERLAVLSKYHQGIEKTFQLYVEQISRKAAGKDDIIDCLCLAISAYYSKNFGIQSIKGTTERDSYDLPMTISFYKAG